MSEKRFPFLAGHFQHIKKLSAAINIFGIDIVLKVKKMKKKIIFLISNLILISFVFNGSVKIWAIEGFWEPNSIPPNLKTQFNLSENLIEQIRKSTLRLSNGGTGVFVSSNGLVLTNQHTVIDFVQKITNNENNYIRDGYFAKDQNQEIKLPDAKISVTELQKDVTETINSNLKTGMPPNVVRNVIISQSRQIAAKTKEETGLDCEVLSTFNGTRHTLYGYKTYNDVRLVSLPEKNVALFGGDRENYKFPRYWLDISFLRIYENERPLQNNQFLPFSKGEIKNNEDLIVAGFPISSERNLASFQLEYLQNTELPLISSRIKTQLASLVEYGKLGNEQAAEVQSQIFDLENSLKAIEGRTAQMKKNNLVAKTKKSEQEMLGKLKNDKEFSKDAEALNILEKIYLQRAEYEAERRFLDDGWALDTVFFRTAREHVRWATEKAKPLSERLPGFNDDLLNRLEGIMKGNVPRRELNEGKKLENSLTMMKNTLGANHPTVLKILENRTPKERAEELLKTELDTQQFRNALIEKGKTGLDESTDPMVALLRWVDGRALELRGKHQNLFVSPEAENYQKFVNTMYRYGMNKKYPDANFSLRFSFGKVSGYTESGKKTSPFTSFGGFYKMAKDNNYSGFYDISDLWKKNNRAAVGRTAFNFALTNDVLGGNSGSPVVNTKGELVGLIFDSNMPSLLWKYQYDEAEGRAIAVDNRAIKLALELYQAGNILKEIQPNQ